MDYALELEKLADDFDRMERLGNLNDVPEGSRYITISDTLAKQIAAFLREAAGAERCDV